MSFGRSNQLTAVALNRPTSIGCKTLTPTRAAMTPVIAGKMDPPICPRTKTNAGRVSSCSSECLRVSVCLPIAGETISGGKSLDPTDIPWISIMVNQMAPTDRWMRSIHTVAKKGPEKNPIRLTATASVMIFGVLVHQSKETRYLRSRKEEELTTRKQVATQHTKQHI